MQRLRDRKRRWAKPFAVMVADLAAAERLAAVGAAGAGPARRARRGRSSSLRRAPARRAAPRAVRRRRQPPARALPALHAAPPPAAGGRRPADRADLRQPLRRAARDRRRRAADRLAGLADAFLVHDREIRARYDDSVSRVVAGRESIVRRGPRLRPRAAGPARGRRAADPGGRRGAEAHVHPRPRAARPRRARTTATSRTCRPTGPSRTASPTSRGCSPWSPRSSPTTSTRSTSRRSTPSPASRPSGASPSSTTTPTSPRAPPSTASPARSSGSPTTASGWATTGRSGAARSSLADLVGYRRLARFGRAPMPGGALAVKRPYRMALGYLLGAEARGRRPAARDGAGATPRAVDPDLAAAFLARLDPREVAVLRIQVARRLNAPVASSAGRLFDAAAVAARPARRRRVRGAGGDRPRDRGRRPARPRRCRAALARVDGLLVYDPRPTLRGAPRGRRPPAGRRRRSPPRSTRRSPRSPGSSWPPRPPRPGCGTVCLSGGVFQNRRLASTLLRRLGRRRLRGLHQSPGPGQRRRHQLWSGGRRRREDGSRRDRGRDAPVRRA